MQAFLIVLLVVIIMSANGAPTHSPKSNLTQSSPKVPKEILWATAMVALSRAQPDRALGLQQNANIYSAPGTFQEIAMEMLYKFPFSNNTSGKCELEHFFEETGWDKSPWIVELVGVQKIHVFGFVAGAPLVNANNTWNNHPEVNFLSLIATIMISSSGIVMEGGSFNCEGDGEHAQFFLRAALGSPCKLSWPQSSIAPLNGMVVNRY